MHINLVYSLYKISMCIMIFVHSERLASFKLEEFGRKLALPTFLSLQRLANVDSLHIVLLNFYGCRSAIYILAMLNGYFVFYRV